ncbi:retropepsin-like aspartic protease [Sphingomonas sp. MMS24-J13]|uniref:retropepsin-like aspartic protease n=1 Tax=Sphingomonas sp. MMS24-J13 TaxID=3238686 RepID=UPI00384BCD45
MRKIVDLPVTMDGLRPIVPATLNGTDVQLIADSGAYFSLISPSTASQLGLTLERMPIGFLLQGIGDRLPARRP